VEIQKWSSLPGGAYVLLLKSWGLGIREWTCDDCGTVHDRDVIAAKNILRCG